MIEANRYINLLLENSDYILEYSIDAEEVPVGKWAGRIMFHGTSKEEAKSIRDNGVDNSKSSKGYFGRGFYMASDYNHAKKSYAEMSDDHSGEIIILKISDKAKILDLRSEKDSQKWLSIKPDNYLWRDDFDLICVRNKIDGLFDRSFGGVVVYNPKMLQVIK